MNEEFITEEWQRFFRLRQRVFAAIEKIVTDPEDDGHHKSYEGAMTVRICFDNYFIADSVYDTYWVRIELNCYLLFDDSHIWWGGQTFSEALDKAEDGINSLLEGYE